jgi:hypothetical protein
MISFYDIIETFNINAIELYCMHTTAAGERRKAQRLQAEADSALVEAEALKVQARLEDLDVWEMEKVKQTKKGLQDLHLLDGLLARGRQDVQCSPGEHQEDGCRGSPPEGQGDEGGGAGGC